MKVELLGMIKQLSDASVKRKIELQARSKAKNVRPAATNQQGNSIEMDQIQSDETSKLKFKIIEILKNSIEIYIL